MSEFWSDGSASRMRVLLSAGVAAGLTVSLLSGSPAVAAPGDGPGRPAVQKTRSADVSKVVGKDKRVEDQTREAAKKPRKKPVFPADGEAATVPVDDSWSPSTEFGVSVRSKDPARAPENVAVKVVGQSSEDGVGGGGLILEVTPTKDAPAASGQPDDPAASPSPADEPTMPPDDSSSTTEPTPPAGEVSERPDPESTDSVGRLREVRHRLWW